MHTSLHMSPLGFCKIWTSCWSFMKEASRMNTSRKSQSKACFWKGQWLVDFLVDESFEPSVPQLLHAMLQAVSVQA
jgi:hypothetical protein